MTLRDASSSGGNGGVLISPNAGATVIEWSPNSPEISFRSSSVRSSAGFCIQHHKSLKNIQFFWKLHRNKYGNLPKHLAQQLVRWPLVQSMIVVVCPYSAWQTASKTHPPMFRTEIFATNCRVILRLRIYRRASNQSEKKTDEEMRTDRHSVINEEVHIPHALVASLRCNVL